MRISITFFAILITGLRGASLPEAAAGPLVVLETGTSTDENGVVYDVVTDSNQDQTNDAENQPVGGDASNNDPVVDAATQEQGNSQTDADATANGESDVEPVPHVVDEGLPDAVPVSSDAVASQPDEIPDSRCSSFQEPHVWYPNCIVTEVETNCFKIDCPTDYQECVGADGTRHKVDSGEWAEEKTGRPYVCQCVHPNSVYWAVPPRPIGAPDFSPMKSCDLEGCENYRSGGFLKPGDEMNTERDHCRCVRGQDPLLMDAATRYYLHCEQLRPEGDRGETELENPEEPSPQQT